MVSWYFFLYFVKYICVGTLQNINFNMKDPGNFDNCNILFLNEGFPTDFSVTS